MKILVLIVSLGLLISCNSNKAESPTSQISDNVGIVDDTIFQGEVNILKDTIITYNIEGVSTEGIGAEVKYVNG